MKIYVVDGYRIEDDFHLTSGIFIELSLAQSIEPLNGIDLIIIKEMTLLDSQFVRTGFTNAKELETDCEHNVWSEWIEHL